MNDASITALITHLRLNTHTNLHYTISEGLLRNKGQICVSNNGSLRSEILSIVHSSSMGGHSGILGTYQRAKFYFHWPGMKASVSELVTTCDICQINNWETTHPTGLL